MLYGILMFWNHKWVSGLGVENQSWIEAVLNSFLLLTGRYESLLFDYGSQFGVTFIMIFDIFLFKNPHMRGFSVNVKFRFASPTY